MYELFQQLMTGGGFLAIGAMVLAGVWGVYETFFRIR